VRPGATPARARARGRGARGRGRETRLQRSDATREKLLAAATEAICRLGIQGASIDAIAASAGYTKGAFYAHFDSKEELFLVMLEEHFDAEIERLESVLAGAGEPVAEARQAAEGFLAKVEGDPQWRRVCLEFTAYAIRNDAFRAELAARERALRAQLARVFERWAADLGLEPTVAADDVAAMTMCMADGFLLNRMIDTELPERLYGAMFELFALGLLAKTSSE
jgi:AcrR family transcriptional regulator